jgi:hypothetical protein
VGDEKQLAPYVKTEGVRINAEMDRSLFSRFFFSIFVDKCYGY